MHPSHIEETFGPDGHLARRLPLYEARSQQVELAEAIDAALEVRENIVAEAPCGSGKSIAYLVPAIVRALEDGKSRVVVATANIALQEQLVKKDLPLLREALPWPFEFALAKGRANFACLDRIDSTRADAAIGAPFDGETLVQWRRIDEWVRTTVEGDLSELPFEVRADLRPRISTGADECLGKACERYDECFAEKMKQRAESAKVVVANYHLLFADLQVKAATDHEVGVLPNYDILILDEADKMPDISRDFYGFRIVEGSIRWATRLLAPTGSDAQKLPQIDAELKDRIARVSARFFAELLAHRRSKEYRARLRRPDVAPWKELHALLNDAVRLYEANASTPGLDQADRKKLRNASKKCEQIASSIERAMTLGSGDRIESDDVFYLEEIMGDRCALRGAPVDVAKQLRRDIWAADLRSAVAVSATLTTGDTFDFFVRESGAEGARELVVDSPFAVARNMLVVIPAEASDPREREFVERAGDLVTRAIGRAQGRTLGLFTSYRGLKEAAYRVRRIHGHTYEIMVQGEAPRMQLIARFREDVSSVLLGTDSFWTGVDVPGEALSCLVIDKIPFPSPDDPILDALDERERDAWKKHALPRALIQFRQGIGRLLRTATDRGVVMICDPRIVEKSYGKTFLRACGGARVSRDIDDIQAFLNTSSDEPRLTTKVGPKTGARASRRRESTI